MSSSHPSSVWWKSAYQALFQRIARIRLHRGDIDPAVIHTHLITVLSTSVLMWFYAILACVTISSPWPGIIGLTTSALHLLSPWLFRYTANGLLVCSCMLACGMIHQAGVTAFTGGFSSSIIVWFAFLPLLAGFIAGRTAAVLWFVLTMIGAGIFFTL